jgi:hypothetical protein
MDGEGHVLKALRGFMAKVIFDDDVGAVAAPDLELWMRAVLRARDRRMLESGRMRMLWKGRWRSFGLDLGNVNSQLRNVQQKYADQFREFQKKKLPLLTPKVWADMVLARLNKPMTSSNRDLILERCDAAYRFDKLLFELYKDPKYNPFRHGPEIVDAQQLYYLCDTEMLFITEEKSLKNKVIGSSQLPRILTFSELKERVS